MESQKRQEAFKAIEHFMLQREKKRRPVMLYQI